MKATEIFKNAIKAYLDRRAADDALFAVSYAKAGKSLDECVNYIFSEVQKSGCNGFADSEIYGMAVHYYDEDDIRDIKPINGARVVVNHVVELTEEEKREAKKNAIKQYEADIIADIKRKEEEKRAKARANQPKQASLFDL